MGKHTPGPWAVNFEYLEDVPGIPYIVKGDIAIAMTCRHYPEPCSLTDEERTANATLIAAAPDMLALLIKLDNDTEVCNALSEHLAKLLGEVISKAQGEG